MSDDEVTFGDAGDEYGEVDGQDEFDATPADEGAEGDTSTPEGKYRAAKDYIGFDDMNAVCLFYDIYNDEEASLDLRMRALRRAAVVLSQHDDVEQIIQAVDLIFACYECQWLDGEKCKQTIREMLSNVVRSEEGLTQFLERACEKVDKVTQTDLFLDLKLRQSELMMKYADYEKAAEYLKEAEQFCPLPPDPNDPVMCRCAIRILILKIEFADMENNEEAMFDYYAQASEIPKQTLSTRQNAVLMQLEGLKAFKRRDFRTARSKFFDAFTAFNEMGSDKRVKCLPYCSLAAMLSHEAVSIFMAPEVMSFSNHPVVAPVSQLNDAYRSADIVLFNERVPAAQQVFKSPFYNELIDEVRHYVLAGALQKYCPNFSRVHLSFVAKELKSKESEVVAIVYNLIVCGKLHGLVDPSESLLIMQKPHVKSPYMENLDYLLDGLERIVDKMHHRVSLKIKA